MFQIFKNLTTRKEKIIYDKPIKDINYGSLITVEHFKLNVQSGGFIDYDGFGHPVKNNFMNSHINIYPSEVPNCIPSDATHILWFNK